MKIRKLLWVLSFVTPVFAQEPATSQMQCHNIVSGAQLAADEMVVDDKVCRKFQSASSVQAAVLAPEPTHTAGLKPAQPNAPASVPSPPAASSPAGLLLSSVPAQAQPCRTHLTGFDPVVRTDASTSTEPVSGNGTVTDNYGGRWKYTYNGTVTATTTTTTNENVPYTIRSNKLVYQASPYIDGSQYIPDVIPGTGHAVTARPCAIDTVLLRNKSASIAISVEKDIEGPKRK